MEKTIIMGIQVGDRNEDAPEVQKILTEFGCIIKIRLGLHDAINTCSSSGLIILEFVKGKEKEIKSLEDRLNSIKSVKMKIMDF